MKEYIERSAVMQKFADCVKRSNNSDFAPTPTWNEAVQIVEDAPTVDAVPVVRCRECKHKPTKPEKYIYGIDLEFPDEACPCYHADEPFSSWYPSDDWFCPRGERKGGCR